MIQRPIKFRAWNTHTKTWAREDEIDLYDFDNAWESIRALDEQTLVNSDEPLNIVLMQFTGLHDKNGKEIWEGDIIRHYNVFTKQYIVRKEPIAWEATHCGFNLWHLVKYNEDVPEEYRGLEVIGNIYENPELIDQSK